MAPTSSHAFHRIFSFIRRETATVPGGPIATAIATVAMATAITVAPATFDTLSASTTSPTSTTSRANTASAPSIAGAAIVESAPSAPPAPAAPASADGQWTQWAGPGRDFHVPNSAPLANAWPSSGPRERWSRGLGEGHSAILVDRGRLYTQYRPLGLLSVVRRSQEEVVVALDASTGTTVWEHRYPAPTDALDFQYGAGPHATPLIVGSRLFAAGSNKQLFALDTQTGRVLWAKDFVKDYGAPPAGRGFSPSPLAYKDTIIMPVGGNGQAVAAFHQQDGRVVWKRHDFQIAPASPILIDVNGQTQVVVFGGTGVYGLDPATGALLWSHSHQTEWGLNISTPVWSDGVLLVSSAYNAGTRALQISRPSSAATATTRVEERWFTNRVRVHIGSIVRIGQYAYASSGDFGPCPITAFDVANGRIVWQDRSFARASFLAADGKLIILDEDGMLGLAIASPQGLKVLAKAAVLTSRAWTVPTLAGTHLYVRDRKTIKALDLGKQAG